MREPDHFLPGAHGQPYATHVWCHPSGAVTFLDTARSVPGALTPEQVALYGPDPRRAVSRTYLHGEGTQRTSDGAVIYPYNRHPYRIYIGSIDTDPEPCD